MIGLQFVAPSIAFDVSTIAPYPLWCISRLWNCFLYENLNSVSPTAGDGLLFGMGKMVLVKEDENEHTGAERAVWRQHMMASTYFLFFFFLVATPMTEGNKSRLLSWTCSSGLGRVMLVALLTHCHYSLAIESRSLTGIWSQNRGRMRNDVISLSVKAVQLFSSEFTWMC